MRRANHFAKPARAGRDTKDALDEKKKFLGKQHRYIGVPDTVSAGFFNTL